MRMKAEAFLQDKKVADFNISKSVHIRAKNDVSIPIEATPSLKDIAALALSNKLTQIALPVL